MNNQPVTLEIEIAQVAQQNAKCLEKNLSLTETVVQSMMYRIEEIELKKIPEKVWLVLGHRPAKVLKVYDYPTDPRYYNLNLPVFKKMTDLEYKASADQIKAFSRKEDAIDFVYECGLLTTLVFGFRLVDGEYEEDGDIANEVLDTRW